MVGHAGLGESLFHLGELTAAHEHLEQAWGLYQPQEHNAYITQTWVDPGVVCLSYMPHTLWSLGYPDQAQRRLRECLALAEGLSHPYSLAFALTNACFFSFLHQEWQRAKEWAEEVMRLATEQEFPYWLACGTALREWR